MDCSAVEDKIAFHGYKIWDSRETPEACMIDFYHPRVKVRPPVAYFLSAVLYNKKRNTIETTIRSKVDDFKELYLDYCCETLDGECSQVYRPHVHMGNKPILQGNVHSIHAIFHGVMSVGKLEDSITSGLDSYLKGLVCNIFPQ